MKFIEVRIHAPKDEYENITPEGEMLAEKVGQGLGVDKFDLFIIAPNNRCRQTMIKFGVSEKLIAEDERFNPLPDKEVSDYHKKGEDIENVGDFFEIPELQNLLHSTAQRVLEAINDISRRLPEGGQALVVSHGGAIVPAAHLVTKIDFSNFKKIPDCGGINFEIKNDKIIGYKIIVPVFIQ